MLNSYIFKVQDLPRIQALRKRSPGLPNGWTDPWDPAGVS